jgi:pentapeptide repeat protein
VGVVWLIVPGVVVAVAAVAVVVAAAAKVAVSRLQWLLIASLLGAVSALLLVTGWLLTDPASSRVEALKTGGLAGGAVLALYALWINDRRRRTEEARQEVERIRVEQDRERAANERFAKAVELLGNAADQVRVGGLHALAGLARDRPHYTQTVIDVLCSYLRRPFTHPSYLARPGDPDQAEIAADDSWSVEQIADADRERQVRLTAQRLIVDLLPGTSEPEPARYDLDLTEASVAYLNLTDRVVGRLAARRARFLGITRLGGVRVHGPALFTGAAFLGRVELDSAAFDGGLSLQRARHGGGWQLTGAVARVFADLRTSAPADQVGMLTIAADARLKIDKDTGWSVGVEGDGDQLGRASGIAVSSRRTQ